LQIGVIYPQTELGGDPDGVRQFALAAERLGYQHINAYDHVVGASHDNREPALWGPYTEADPFHDPFVLFAYLAGITALEFATDVLILPQRQTVLVAKQAADLDLLSGGRFRLGVGTGVLGGFTTWSSLAFEVQQLGAGGDVGLGVAYGVGSVVVGFLTCTLGVVLAAWLRRARGTEADR